MSAEIVPFSFNGTEVRMLDVAGDPWFIAADVCSVLGIVNVSDALGRLDEDEKGIGTTDTLGGPQRVSLVSEPGLYGLTWTSRKPEAAQFRRRVKHEVLPAIRKTGSYSVAPVAAPVELSRIEILTLAMESEQRAVQLEAKVTADAPKVEYVDTFVADGDLRLLRAVAKDLNVTESALRDDLLARRWIFKETATRWSEKKQEKEVVARYSPYSHKAMYFQTTPVHDAPRFRGEVMHTLKVTPQGASAISRLFRLSIVEVCA